MYHIFLIISSVEGHLGCFRVLAMTNNAAMNIVEHMSLGTIEHPLDIYPKVVLLGLEEGCFQVLAMTNNAAMNIVEHMSCGTIEHPLDIYPKVVLLGLEESCFLIF